MSSDHPSVARGVVAIPDDLAPHDPRKEREDAAIADVEARVDTGQLSGEDADAELFEIALARFDYLAPDALEELREFGREVIKEPEMVGTRLQPRSSRGSEGEGSEGEGGP